MNHQAKCEQIENGGERDDGFCGYNAITPGIPLMAARARTPSRRASAAQLTRARRGSVRSAGSGGGVDRRDHLHRHQFAIKSESD